MADRDDLPRIGAHFHNDAVSVSLQRRIIELVGSTTGVSLGDFQPGGAGIRGGQRSFVLLLRNREGLEQLFVPVGIGHGTFIFGTSGNDCLLGGSARQFEVNRVESHQGLTSLDVLALIDQFLDDLPRHAKAEVTLRVGMDGAGITRGRRIGVADREAPHDAGGILRDRRLFASSENDDARNGDNSKGNNQPVVPERR